MTSLDKFTPVSRLRMEDRRLITGAGRYVADLAPTGTLRVAFVRSTEAHATVTGIDTEMAVDQPGVVGVFTAADDTMMLPGRVWGCATRTPTAICPFADNSVFPSGSPNLSATSPRR